MKSYISLFKSEVTRNLTNECPNHTYYYEYRSKYNEHFTHIHDSSFTFIPKWKYAFGVATRPLGVR